MDGGVPWWPEVAAWSGTARDGGSRGGEPPLLTPSPRVGKDTGVWWVRPRDRVGSRVTRAAGVGHAEVGFPASSWLLGRVDAP